MFVVAVLVTTGGFVVQLTEMTGWSESGASAPGSLTTSHQEAAARFVHERIQPGDVVITTVPHLDNLYLDWPADFWLQTEMVLQHTLDDYRSIPLHRLAGSISLTNPDELRAVFNQWSRVWFIAFPPFSAKLNVEEASRLIRENMDVVYENFGATVLFRANNHLPATLHHKSEISLRNARVNYLP